MPPDRTSLTQPATTNVPAGAIPPVANVNANANLNPANAGHKPSTGAGQRPIAGSNATTANKPPNGGGGDELLPDARK